MRVCFFLAECRVKVSSPESNDYINEEDKVDECISEHDGLACDDRVSLVSVEDGDGDSDRVVHGQDDHDVVPVLNEGALVTEKNLPVRGYQLLLLLLRFKELINVESLVIIFFTAGLAFALWRVAIE